MSRAEPQQQRYHVTRITPTISLYTALYGNGRYFRRHRQVPTEYYTPGDPATAH